MLVVASLHPTNASTTSKFEKKNWNLKNFEKKNMKNES